MFSAVSEPVFPQVTSRVSAYGCMKVKYKATARGGLAVNVIEC